MFVEVLIIVIVAIAEILLTIYTIIDCFILYELATMSPLGWHLAHLVDNTDTLYLGDLHLQQTVLVFLDFYFFVLISSPMCQSVCVSVGFESSLLRGSQWPLSQKMIKTLRLTSSDWGCPLDNDPKLVLGQPNSR